MSRVNWRLNRSPVRIRKRYQTTVFREAVRKAVFEARYADFCSGAWVYCQVFTPISRKDDPERRIAAQSIRNANPRGVFRALVQRDRRSLSAWLVLIWCTGRFSCVYSVH
jgi:hypothetical protein